MSLIAKLLLSLVIAILASTLTNLMLTGEVFAQPLLLLSFFVATAATALIVGAKQASTAPNSNQVTQKPPARDANRDHGTVKWFNVSKGFGFIVKDDGEEIFVHFRSIRGDGRRSLRDGQSVSFIVAESDKGPQAEDVMGED
jgi:CspA family cold shock protein